MSLTDFDNLKWFLGNICKRNHDWKNSGCSLRTQNGGRCVECARDRSHRHYINNKENKKIQEKINRSKNRDAYNLRKKLYHRKRRLTGETQKIFRKYQQSEKGRLKFQYHNRIRRAKKKKAALLAYSPQEVINRFSEFNGSCAYCNKKFPNDGTGRQIDHFIPLSKGGTDVLGNIVPSCISCNSSKYNHDPIAWFRSKGFPEKRLKKVLKVLGKTEANYNQIPLL